MKQRKLVLVLLGFAVLAAGLVLAQGARNQARMANDAANRTFVPPGEHDEFYGFFSGGFNGQLSVVGLPSGRTIKNIPVFSQYGENGYGYSEETKALFNTSHGPVYWDDSHHPELSMTNGVPDGRWIFINGNNTPRIARIDLSTFETVEIIEIPNVAGNHPSPFTTMNSEYVVAGTRFSVPVPQRDMPISEYKDNFKGMLTFVSVDKASGEMAVAFQVMMPGFDYDLAHCGKGPSADWCFFTSYNSEQAHTLLEVNASQNDKDFVAAVNWRRAEQCVAEGKTSQLPSYYAHNVVNEATHTAETTWHESVTVLQPEECEGLVYFLPTPKSPHGVDVDPTGQFIVTGGKLSATIAVHGFSNMLQAIADQKIEGYSYGVPVLDFDATVAGQVERACLGPLHNEFDSKGNVYTSCFITSEIIKWDTKKFEVSDRIPVYYSIGHLMIPGGDSMQPWDKYVVALNKITKDRYLPTGPELTQSAQLIDISGNTMQMLLDFPTLGEPHYAQAIPANLVAPNSKLIYDLAANEHPYVVKNEGETKVVRDGTDVHVYMSSIRSHFAPDNIEGVKVGDTVYWHVTNLEQDWDVPHGFAVQGMQDANILIKPGQTLTVTWKPTKPGVYPFYCTDFCSALHQEMQGYVRVSPADADIPLSWSVGL
ncbi:MAG: Sec-dependent nitrous-oxide reductase [Trueperaceae bacterium]|nr:Sec-dependent nitrous-oxide reductase [Trueperaceae bacterium]MCO5173500.1 Sec-dependent nitrous-oxide reductase [Trueperaceae bacterium]MCW5820152.1 Sec-dependent nitrous-oxide reductase [Trueperaceae bacterium]